MMSLGGWCGAEYCPCADGCAVCAWKWQSASNQQNNTARLLVLFLQLGPAAIRASMDKQMLGARSYVWQG